MYSSCLWRNWDWIDQPSFTFYFRSEKLSKLIFLQFYLSNVDSCGFKIEKQNWFIEFEFHFNFLCVTNI
jgi:hypothetical protein